MFRLAHISDLHLLTLQGTTPLSFLNKRATGGLNLLLRRAHTHRAELVELALADIERLDVDHLVVTGDLTNLSLEAEFTLARDLLETYGNGREVSVIPGNHDCYTYRSGRTRAFERAFAELMQSDLPELVTDRCYPWVKLFDGVALIGLSSAIATPPPLASGRVSKAQLAGLGEILAHPEVTSRFSVVLVHHHFFKPSHKRLDRLRRLSNRDAVLDTLLAGGADLVLHGHNHRHAYHEIPRGEGDGVLRICEAGSTSAAHPEDDERAAKFNIYEIDRESDDSSDPGRLVAVRAYSHRLDDEAPNSDGQFIEWKTIEPGR